jgi:hypothetical protein
MATGTTTTPGQNKMSKEDYFTGNKDLISFCVCRPLSLVTLSSDTSSSCTVRSSTPLINDAKYSEAMRPSILAAKPHDAFAKEAIATATARSLYDIKRQRTEIAELPRGCRYSLRSELSTKPTGYYHMLYFICGVITKFLNVTLRLFKSPEWTR